MIAAGSVHSTFAKTQFTGENYTVGYTATGVSLTGPAGTPPPGGTKAVHVGPVSGGKGQLTVKVSCPSGGAACSKVTFKATVTEHLQGSKLLAVSARKHSKTKRKVVVIASASLSSLAAGTSKTVTLKFNKVGLALLKRFKSLKTTRDRDRERQDRGPQHRARARAGQEEKEEVADARPPQARVAVGRALADAGPTPPGDHDVLAGSNPIHPVAEPITERVGARP